MSLEIMVQEECMICGNSLSINATYEHGISSTGGLNVDNVKLSVIRKFLNLRTFEIAAVCSSCGVTNKYYYNRNEEGLLFKQNISIG